MLLQNTDILNLRKSIKLSARFKSQKKINVEFPNTFALIFHLGNTVVLRVWISQTTSKDHFNLKKLIYNMRYVHRFETTIPLIQAHITLI